ncbi:MAG TPA: hydrogenase maturation nickel metallochaperone HypA [Acidimicrobiales bacterium]
MHELGLCAAIVQRVEERAGDRPVARVRVRVGRLHHVHPDAFEQSFLVAAQGGVAEAATPELVLLPVRARCRACGEESEADEQILACPACGAVEVVVTGGDELVLESIEYRG